MIAGKLRHKAEFCKATTTQDSTGAPIKTWPIEFTRRFRVAQSDGKEFQASQQTNAEMTHLLVFRYVDKTSAEIVKYRINFDNRRFDVLEAIDMNERHRETHISVREIL